MKRNKLNKKRSKPNKKRNMERNKAKEIISN